jgi:hypothetical protein
MYCSLNPIDSSPHLCLELPLLPALKLPQLSNNLLIVSESCPKTSVWWLSSPKPSVWVWLEYEKILPFRTRLRLCWKDVNSADQSLPRYDHLFLWACSHKDSLLTQATVDIVLFCWGINGAVSDRVYLRLSERRLGWVMMLLDIFRNIFEISNRCHLIPLKFAQLGQQLRQMLVQRWWIFLNRRRNTDCGFCFICWRRSVTSDLKFYIQTECVTLLLYPPLYKVEVECFNEYVL